MWLYKLTKDANSKDEIKLERKGTNPSVAKERVVHLCAIDESKHVVLIKEIDEFLKAAREGHVYRGNIANKKMCKICTMYQPVNDFDNHYNCCKSDKKFIPTAVLPKPDYTFSFTANDALAKAPFVCYFDFETVLIPVDSSCGVKNAYHRHEAIAAQCVNVDRDKNVKAYECLIGDDNISKKLQQSILDK